MNSQILYFLKELKRNSRRSLVLQKRLVLEEDWSDFEIFDSISFSIGLIKIGYSSLDFMLIEYSIFEEVESKMIQIRGRNPSDINSIIKLNIYHYINKCIEEVKQNNPGIFYSLKQKLFNWESDITHKIYRFNLDRMFE